jgi:hypothetical protein
LVLTDNKNATVLAYRAIGTCGIVQPKKMPAGIVARPEKAAHYTQRFALLQQRDSEPAAGRGA